MTPELLCSSPESQHFLNFIQNIFQLKFEETPNYEKLRFMLVTELLDLGESPSKKYDWNEQYFQNGPTQNQMRRQINNMSCESIEFNEDDMDENGGAVNNHDCEVGDNISDKEMALQSNLDLKMKNMQGYNFKNNENFKAMKKIIPVLDNGHVVINSDTIQKMNANQLEYDQLFKQESLKCDYQQKFEQMIIGKKNMMMNM